MANKNEIALTRQLLQAAWLTDGGKLFVKPDFFDKPHALKWFQSHNYVDPKAKDTDARIFLQEDIVQRDAGQMFSVKDTARVELMDPEAQLAFDILSHRRLSTTRDSGAICAYIPAADLQAIDPDGAALRNQWVNPADNEVHYDRRDYFHGSHRLDIAALEARAGVSLQAAQGEDTAYVKPARKARIR